ATALFRWLPLLTVVALAANATAALLQGNGRFREFALATATSVGVFAVAVVVLVEPGAHLRALIVAGGLRYAHMCLCGVARARGPGRCCRRCRRSGRWAPTRLACSSPR